MAAEVDTCALALDVDGDRLEVVRLAEVAGERVRASARIGPEWAATTVSPSPGAGGCPASSAGPRPPAARSPAAASVARTRSDRRRTRARGGSARCRRASRAAPRAACPPRPRTRRTPRPARARRAPAATVKLAKSRSARGPSTAAPAAASSCASTSAVTRARTLVAYSSRQGAVGLGGQRGGRRPRLLAAAVGQSEVALVAGVSPWRSSRASSRVSGRASLRTYTTRGFRTAKAGTRRRLSGVGRDGAAAERGGERVAAIAVPDVNATKAAPTPRARRSAARRCVGARACRSASRATTRSGERAVAHASRATPCSGRHEAAERAAGAVSAARAPSTVPQTPSASQPVVPPDSVIQRSMPADMPPTGP